MFGIARNRIAVRARCSFRPMSAAAAELTHEQKMEYLNKAPYVLPNHKKISSPPMVYISGEEMTRYTMKQMLECWVKPHLETSSWEFYDLSCRSRDNTEDQVLADAVAAGKRVCSIFKEPTITPTAAQVEELKLKKAWGSPNGAMRRGWNGVSISRDTIHIEGVKLGYDQPVLFDRHAVGGEYGAGWKEVKSGRLVTQFFPSDGSAPVLCDDRTLKDKHNVVVTYHNPLDNVEAMGHVFFQRCLDMGVVPYIVTKKTVFKWQEGFWRIMKDVFDEHYQQKYIDAGIIKDGVLHHLISDNATMQIIRWTKGGFGMCAHNYDGDMLTDEIAQVHRSPGFITSNLVGRSDDGKTPIKEFEASHGTVTDLWHAHLRGEETSMNPLGLAEALMSALNHSADLRGGPVKEEMKHYTSCLRLALHNTFRFGEGTRDMAGPTGLTTEQFMDKVAWRLGRYLVGEMEEPKVDAPVDAARKHVPQYKVASDVLQQLMAEFDPSGTGKIGVEELERILAKLGVAPQSVSDVLSKNEKDRITGTKLEEVH